MILFFIYFYKCYENFQNDFIIDYYVIHIRTYKLRYQNILFNQNKLNKNIEIYDGVVGKTLDFDNLKIFDPNLKINFKYEFINEVGCYLSHLMLIKSLLNKNTGYTVVFEDDFIILDENLDEKIKNIINKMNIDFDIIFLGNLNNNYAENYIDDIYYINKNGYLWGTHGYLINNKNALKIYNKLLNMDLAIDNKYKKLINNDELVAFTIYPILVDQEREKYKSLIR